MKESRLAKVSFQTLANFGSPNFIKRLLVTSFRNFNLEYRVIVGHRDSRGGERKGFADQLKRGLIKRHLLAVLITLNGNSHWEPSQRKLPLKDPNCAKIINELEVVKSVPLDALNTYHKSHQVLTSVSDF